MGSLRVFVPAGDEKAEEEDGREATLIHFLNVHIPFTLKLSTWQTGLLVCTYGWWPRRDLAVELSVPAELFSSLPEGQQLAPDLSKIFILTEHVWLGGVWTGVLWTIKETDCSTTLNSRKLIFYSKVIVKSSMKSTQNLCIIVYRLLYCNIRKFN